MQIIPKQSLQNFAHVMTALLSCHVQNFVVICLLLIELQQSMISAGFEFVSEKSWSEMGALAYCS